MDRAYYIIPIRLLGIERASPVEVKIFLRQAESSSIHLSYISIEKFPTSEEISVKKFQGLNTFYIQLSIICIQLGYS